MGIPTRLSKDLKDMLNDPPPLCSAGPIGNNTLHWQGSIIGPSGTPYEGGVFILDIHFSSSYPFKPPNIQFKTPIFHPNITDDGIICLCNQKSAASLFSNTMANVISNRLLSICSILCEPNVETPCYCTNSGVLQIYQNNQERYKEIARAMCEKYAMQQ